MYELIKLVETEITDLDLYNYYNFAERKAILRKWRL